MPGRMRWLRKGFCAVAMAAACEGCWYLDVGRRTASQANDDLRWPALATALLFDWRQPQPWLRGGIRRGGHTLAYLRSVTRFQCLPHRVGCE